jgi:excinuclease UvrABC nuclease subunit
MVTEHVELPFGSSGPVDIAALPKAALTDNRALPAYGGVYFALDGASRVWYVGIATSLRERHMDHDRMPDFKRAGVTQIAWMQEVNDAKRRSLEKALVERFNPPLNRNLRQHDVLPLPLLPLGRTPQEDIDRFIAVKIQIEALELELEQLKRNLGTC